MPDRAWWPDNALKMVVQEVVLRRTGYRLSLTLIRKGKIPFREWASRGRKGTLLLCKTPAVEMTFSEGVVQEVRGPHRSLNPRSSLNPLFKKFRKRGRRCILTRMRKNKASNRCRATRRCRGGQMLVMLFLLGMMPIFFRIIFPHGVAMSKGKC